MKLLNSRLGAMVILIAVIAAAQLSAQPVPSNPIAQPVHVSSEGIGQVLIYPYYTTRSGWSTLLSIVNNDSINGKALKVRFLEGRNGALVGSLNVFLAADDIWTGAVVAGNADDQPARLVTNDWSCTFPSFRKGITEAGGRADPVFQFDNNGYVTDSDILELKTMDRTREGSIEVIEMASIPIDRKAPTLLAAQIYSLFGLPLCARVADADLPGYSAHITAPSGGLSGSATLINALAGSSAEYSPVALDGFWEVNGASPQLTSSTSPLPDLSSGGNRAANVNYEGKSYFSNFSRSIDALSAVLMTNQLLGEHAYTIDGVIGTTWVMNTPTKRFYTQGVATPPFGAAWATQTGAACDEVMLYSTDRDGVTINFSDDFSARPPLPPFMGLCFTAQVLGFGGSYYGRDAMFGSKNIYGGGYAAQQNGGSLVITAGKEGGKTRLVPSAAGAQLASLSGSVASMDTLTGAVTLTSGKHTFYGLPMVGVVLSFSSFKTGNPQQNFASGFRLNSTRRITSP
jgi:hypothetical protein